MSITNKATNTLLSLVYEDEELLVINKPAGLVVNTTDTNKAISLQNMLEARLGISQPLLGIGGRAGIVHRLDKETSGLVLVAKNQEVFAFLQQQFKARQVVKKYLALVHSEPPSQKGIIDAPLARNPKVRHKFAVVVGGKEAQTYFEVMASFRRPQTQEKFTLLLITPHTGRTHQIRVHLTAMNTPIVGDSLYVGRKRLKTDHDFCPRLFLHAQEITLKLPSQTKTTFLAPLPTELQLVLDRLDKLPVVITP